MTERSNVKNDAFLMVDLVIIIISIIFAFYLIETGFLTRILDLTKGINILGSFVAGIFFTSIFTTAPAIATLGEIARTESLITTALIGGLGAVMGDLLIFKFIKDSLSEHLAELLKHQGFKKRTRVLFRRGIFRWITFLFGGLILASPFPDEIAVSIFGFLHMKTKWFIPISFVFNSAGILLIGLVARAL